MRQKVGRQFLNEENLVPEIFLDKKINISEIDKELYKQITLVAPFGSENPTPIFLIQSVRISKLKKIGREQNHVRFQANQHGAKIDAIGFNLAVEFASIDLELNKVDLVCEFQINDWNGGNKIELKILDLCCSVEKN